MQALLYSFARYILSEGRNADTPVNLRGTVRVRDLNAFLAEQEGIEGEPLGISEDLSAQVDELIEKLASEVSAREKLGTFMAWLQDKYPNVHASDNPVANFCQLVNNAGLEDWAAAEEQPAEEAPAEEEPAGPEDQGDVEKFGVIKNEETGRLAVWQYQEGVSDTYVFSGTAAECDEYIAANQTEETPQEYAVNDAFDLVGRTAGVDYPFVGSLEECEAHIKANKPAQCGVKIDGTILTLSGEETEVELENFLFMGTMEECEKYNQEPAEEGIRRGRHRRIGWWDRIRGK